LIKADKAVISRQTLRQFRAAAMERWQEMTAAA